MNNELKELIYDVRTYNEWLKECNSYMSIEETYEDQNDLFYITKFRINWCALGATDVTRARQFAEDLQRTASKCYDFNERLKMINTNKVNQ